MMAYMGILFLYITLVLLDFGIQSSIAFNCDEFRFGGRRAFTEALKKRNILLNGAWISLKEIYGDTLLENIRPGETFSSIDADYQILMSDKIPNHVNLMSAGGKYTERDLSTDGETFKHSPTLIIQTLMSNAKDSNLPILVYGKPGMGKSTIISKIRTDILTALPHYLSINVDVPELIKNINNEPITFGHIVEGNIHEKYRSLHANLLEFKPEQCKYFFDSVEKVHDDQAKRLLNIIESLTMGGAKVVLTGDATTVKILSQQSITADIHEIAEMTSPQIHEYLTNIWKERIGEDKTGRFTHHKTSQDIDRALSEYVAVFTQALENIKISRDPRTLKFLANEFESRIWERDIDSQPYHVGCLDYMDGKLNEKTLPFVIQAMNVNMHEIYEKIAVKYYGYERSSRFYENHIGIKALELSIRKIETDEIVDSDLLKTFRNDLEAAEHEIDNVISNRKSCLMTKNEVGRLEFIDSEYERFSATRYLVKNIDSKNHFKTLRTILRKSKFNALLESINFESNSIDAKQLEKFMSRLSEMQTHEVLDNILANKHDDLFVKCQIAINKNVMNSYFKSAYVPKDTPKHFLGKIQSSTAAQHPNLLASLKPQLTMKPQSRLEAIVANDMGSTLRSLKNFGIKYEITDYKNILKIAVAKSVPHPELVRILLENAKVKGKLATVDLHELLYHAVSAAGDDSLVVAEILIKEGADPKKCSFDGKTLVDVAVEWSSRSLMKVVTDKWKIPFKSGTRTSLFETALDAMPFPETTLNGAWDMINFVKAKDPTMPMTAPQGKPSMRIPDADKSSPWVQSFSTPGRLFVQPYESVIAKAMARVVPPTKIALTTETLSYRRESVIQEIQTDIKKITPLEVVAKYDISGLSTPADTKAYKQIISESSTIDIKSLKPTDKSRVFENLLETTNKMEDIKVLDNAVAKGLTNDVPTSTIYEMALTTERRKLTLNKQAAASTELKVLTENDMIEIVNNLPTPDINIEGSNLRVDNLEEIKESKIKKIALLADCSSSRRRRGFHGYCQFGKRDLESFVDNSKKAQAGELEINTDKYLKQMEAWESSGNIQDKLKAKQISEYVNELQHVSGSKIRLKGRFQNFAKKVLKHLGLAGYQKNVEMIETIVRDYQSTGVIPHKNVNISPMWRRVSYGTMAAGLMMGVKNMYEVCRTNSNSPECIKTATLFSVSVLIVPSEMLLTKFFPVVFKTPKAISILRWATSTSSVWSHAFNVVAVGLDVYNVVEAGIAINKCLQRPEECPDKMKIDLIITTTFACVSLSISIAITALTVLAPALMISGVGIIVGVAIGIVLVVGQAIALAINKVIHFGSKYDTNAVEDIDNFFYNLFTGRPPLYLRNRQKRTDWIRTLEQYAHKGLSSGDDRLVAFAMGTGKIHDGGNLSPTGSIINMSAEDEKNSRHFFDKIQPRTYENSTLICAVNADPVLTDRTVWSIESSKYRCFDAFVLARQNRWQSATASKGHYMIFDLSLINNGAIYGSHKVNNRFFIYNSLPGNIGDRLSVIGGKDVSNEFYIMDKFTGRIILQNSTRNTLDFSQLNGDGPVKFTWEYVRMKGQVYFDKDIFHVELWNKIPNLNIIGRKRSGDTFSCDFVNHGDLRQTPITIDGRGGNSSSWDHITDCHVNILYPYTGIDTNYQHHDKPYIAHIKLGPAQALSTENTFGYISPRGFSRVVVVFHELPILASSIRVIYSWRDRTLTWKFYHDDKSALSLLINPYRTVMNVNEISDTKNFTTTVFMDSQWNATIYPVIPSHKKHDDEEIRKFNIFSKTASSKLADVLEMYKKMKASILMDDIDMMVEFIHSLKDQTYLMGSSSNDSLLIQNNTMYLSGGNGHDTYSLNANSAQQVWIDNEAEDEAPDTLLINDMICRHLHAVRGSRSSVDVIGSFNDDITLYCSDDDTMLMVKHIIVLRKFILSKHLYIAWNQSLYVFLPYTWTHNAADMSNNIGLALLYRFSEAENGMILTLTSSDNYLILKGLDDESNALAAYKVGARNLALTKKFGTFYSNYIVLQDFFMNYNEDISDKWMNLLIFIYNGDEDHNLNKVEIPKCLTVNDVKKLYYRSLIDVSKSKTVISNSTDEYHIDVNAGTSKNHIIQLDIPKSRNNEKEQILVIQGAEPKEFHAHWHADGISIMLCSNRVNITIKNWCSSIHYRVNSIKFIKSLRRDPIIINNMNQLECQGLANNTNDVVFIQRMNQKFINAQERFLMMYNDNSDKSLLLRCISSMYFQDVAGDDLYKISGFPSFIELLRFAQTTCEPLYSRTNIEKLSFDIMEDSLKNMANVFESMAEPSDTEIILRLHEKISKFNNAVWKQLKSYLLYKSSKFNVHNESSGKILFE